jgi:hypothetical protein
MTEKGKYGWKCRKAISERGVIEQDSKVAQMIDCAKARSGTHDCNARASSELFLYLSVVLLILSLISLPQSPVVCLTLFDALIVKVCHATCLVG